MGVGINDGAAVDIGGLQSRDSNDLQAGAGGQDVSQPVAAVLKDRDLGHEGHGMGGRNGVGDGVLGGLQVHVVVIVAVIVLVVIKEAAAGPSAAGGKPIRSTTPRRNGAGSEPTERGARGRGCGGGISCSAPEPRS